MNVRFRYAAAHAAISAAAVGLFAAAVLLVWYPDPLFRLEGVAPILLLLFAVDVCLGPLLTLLVASAEKPRRELIRDLSVIGAVQLTALGYGAYSTYIARPAFIVFNADRFDIVTNGELVRSEKTGPQQSALGTPSWTGPKWVHVLPPESPAERSDLLFSAVLGGPDLKHYPHLYRPWPASQIDVSDRLRPLSSLQNLSDLQIRRLERARAGTSLTESQLAFVPLMGRQRLGIVLLKRADLSVVAVLDLPPPY